MSARCLFVLVLLAATSSTAKERILSFNSDITIESDASIRVNETITVLSELQAIQHGITREFPTSYKDRFGNAHDVKFKLLNARLDGSNVPVKEVRERNGVVLYLGDPDNLVSKGQHIYEISYSTTRQLGFFKDFDELYWNVTGNGWRFPIDSATATIRLPPKVTKQSIKFDAYTGHFGETGKNFNASIHEVDEKTQVVFTSTKPLDSYEGLTVAVGWPKGFVTEPTKMQELVWFLRDNLGVEILLAGLAAILLLYIRAWLRVRRSNEPKTIIPLFEPPADMLPSEMRYLSRMKYDAQVLSCEIVNLAVLGHLTIHSEGGFLGRSSYSVFKTSKATKALSSLQKDILDGLFKGDNLVHIFAKRSDKALIAIVSKIRAELLANVGTGNFARDTRSIVMGVIASALAAVVAFVAQPDPGAMFVVCLGVIVFVNVIFGSRLTAYTVKGRKLMDEIDGFALFLGTTETERLKVIGTPPTRTPELYEKYLPYAMALGVEEQWSKQFTPVFEALAAQNNAYFPIWYIATSGNAFSAPAFSHGLSKSFNAAISSSSQAPGSSSGSGGGGSSGGGGGGGGGGGW